MTETGVAIVVGLVGTGAGVAGQVLNCILSLRVKNAILESERKVLDKVDAHFVRKEICVLARHTAAERP